MLRKKPAAQEFSQHSLGQLVRMQVCRLLYEPQPLNRCGWPDNPPNSQTWKCYFRETIDMNHHTCAIELLQTRNSLFPHVQSRINMILDDGHLVARRQFQDSFA